MGRGWVKIALAIFLLAVGANVVLLVMFFYHTGGAGLARVVWYYLLRDIPDKKYNWGDFVDRGPGTIINGFYSGGKTGYRQSSGMAGVDETGKSGQGFAADGEGKKGWGWVRARRGGGL